MPAQSTMSDPPGWAFLPDEINMEALVMLTSYPAACPHEDCGWMGNLVPSSIRGGHRSEIEPRQPAWFRCPNCGRDWEMRIRGDNLIAVSAAGRAE
jgi:hypothetical protein